MPSPLSFEDWWKRKAPQPPPEPVTLAAVQHVSLIPVVEKIAELPFTFAKAADYVVDIQESPPVITNPDGSFIVSTKLILPDLISLDLAGLGEFFVDTLYATLSTKDQSIVLEAVMDSEPFQPSFKLRFTMFRPDSGNNLPGAGDGGSDGAEAAGSAAGDAATYHEATDATLAGILLPLYGVNPPLVSEPPSGPPLRPRAPYPLTEPLDQDSYAYQIYSALNKDFDHWFNITDYQTSLETALQCALNYRDAIILLREVVNNPSAIPNLGQEQLEDYKLRLANLDYGLRQLQPRFAAQWLDMSREPVSLRVDLKNGQRELEIKWNSLYSYGSIITGLTLYINDTATDRGLKPYTNNTVTMPAPPFSLQGLRVTAKVVSFVAIWGGAPKYAFFSQGKPATRMYEEHAPKASVLNATKQPQPPEGLEYTHLVDPDKLEYNNEAYPVFQVGLYTYWALSYTNKRNAFAILAYDQDRKLVRTWSKTGARYIWDITVDLDKQKVKFIGEGRKSVEFTFNELLAIPIATIADSTLQPTPPEGLQYYQQQGGHSTTYPVVDFLSGYRFWALSPGPDDGGVALAILAYDRNNNLLGRVEKEGARYISRITVQENQVNFFGESNSSVALTAEDLYYLTTPIDPWVPWVTTANVRIQPAAPDGLKYAYPDGDDTSYPVLRYAGFTYWALSYVDDRLSLCILGYDADMVLIQTLTKEGARYISRIELEDSAIRFVGELSNSVSFNFSPQEGLFLPRNDLESEDSE